MEYKKFIALYDIHWGYERKSGHKVARHDEKAVQLALSFAKDFKPDVVILGGDILDCYPISHHERNKPGEKEGLRLITDAEECGNRVIKPLEALGAKELVYIVGNHENWLEDMENEHPGLEGLLNLSRILTLNNQWKVIPQGGYYNLGKITFVHGDQLSGGDHLAKAAVTSYERNIRFGHIHTFQAYTKNSPIDTKFGKCGVAVPCLCKKDQKYTKSRPNKWVQGFNFGYVFPDGTFSDYVPLITNNRTVINGKVYKA